MTKKDALSYAINAINVSCDAEPDQEAIQILQKMIAQLSKPRNSSDEAKAKAKTKRADARGKMLAEVLPVLRVTLTGSDGGFTAKDLYDRCVGQLPAGFTDKKVGYILLHEMADEVVKIETRGKANIYKMKD